MTAPERAPLGAALALLLSVITLTGPVSPALMAGGVGLLGVLLAVAWPDLLELPSALGTRLVVGASGIAAALVTVLAPERITPVAGVLMVCGGGIFAAFVHQMLRRDRHQLTASLTGTVAGVFVAALAASWVVAQTTAESLGEAWLLTAVATGLAATLLTDATPLPATLRFALSVVLGAGTAAVVAVVLGGAGILLALPLGVVTAVAACCSHLLLGSSLTAREPLPSLAVAAGPVATAGVVALLAVVLLG